MNPEAQLPTPERRVQTPEAAHGGERSKSDIKEALEELTNNEGSREVFGDLSSLGDLTSFPKVKATHLLAVCAAIWAQKQSDKASAGRFLSSFRRWSDEHGLTGVQVAERILKELRAVQAADYELNRLSDADKLRDAIIVTLGLTEHLGEADDDRYEIALRAAVWSHIEDGELLPEIDEVKRIFRATAKLWYKGIEEYHTQRRTVEAAYKAILDDL